MGWTPPRDWTNGEIPSQTDFNTHVRDNLRETWHEVAYTEFTASVSSSSATLIDVVSAGAVTYTGAPIFIEFFSPYVLSQAGGGRVALVGDGVDLGNIVAGGADGSTGGSRRLTPTAASHTYKIQICGTGGGGTSTATAGTGGVATNMPGFIRITARGA